MDLMCCGFISCINVPTFAEATAKHAVLHLVGHYRLAVVVITDANDN